MFFFADCHFAIRIAWTYFSTLRDPFIEKFWISKILILGCILYHLYTLIGYLTCCLFSGSRLETWRWTSGQWTAWDAVLTLRVYPESLPWESTLRVVLPWELDYLESLPQQRSSWVKFRREAISLYEALLWVSLRVCTASLQNHFDQQEVGDQETSAITTHQTMEWCNHFLIVWMHSVWSSIETYSMNHD